MNFKRLRNLSIKQRYTIMSIVMVFVFSGILINMKISQPEAIALGNNTSIVDSELGMVASADATDKVLNIAEIVDSNNFNTDVRVPAYILKVDGMDMGIFSSEEEVNELLDTISSLYLNEESDVENVEYKEDIYVVKTNISVDEFNARVAFEDVLYSITRGTDEKRVHKVEAGENYWVIAKKYNIKPSDLEKANPDIKPELLQIGQEISLVVPKPLITTITSEVVEYTEYIDFDTEYEESKALFKGEYKVKKQGVKGEKLVTARLSKENGIEVGKTVLTENETKEPVTKVVIKGIKDPPPKIGTGVLAKPTSRGYLTSKFGTRWGRKHNGIDIGMPVGSDVKAADGGVVTFAGYSSSYGYYVVINHGANTKTLYAHNSKLKVKKGQKVYKGQLIAASGNTGRSTGPHLHFEVIKNGKSVDPSKYVKY